jgi:hypothetical protein
VAPPSAVNYTRAVAPLCAFVASRHGTALANKAAAPR